MTCPHLLRGRDVITHDPPPVARLPRHDPPGWSATRAPDASPRPLAAARRAPRLAWCQPHSEPASMSCSIPSIASTAARAAYGSIDTMCEHGALLALDRRELPEAEPLRAHQRKSALTCDNASNECRNKKFRDSARPLFLSPPRVWLVRRTGFVGRLRQNQRKSPLTS